MLFLTLGKTEPEKTKKVFEAIYAGKLEVPEGIKIIALYSTFGKYDCAAIFEAPDEKTAENLVVGTFRAAGIKTTTILCRKFE